MNVFLMFLSIACFIMMIKADSQPGSAQVTSHVQTRQSKELTDDVHDLENLSVETVFKCLTPKLQKVIYSCNEEIEFKINNTDTSERNSSEEEGDDDPEVLTAEGLSYLNEMSECTMTRSGAIDKATREFNIKYFSEQSSLSPEQKSLVVSGTKSCLSTDSIEPLPPFIVTPIDQESDVKSNNRIPVIRSYTCTVIHLIKNGCADSSIKNSTQTRIINNFVHLKNAHVVESD